jgi:hypothetical protein
MGLWKTELYRDQGYLASDVEPFASQDLHPLISWLMTSRFFLTLHGRELRDPYRGGSTSKC